MYGVLFVLVCLDKVHGEEEGAFYLSGDPRLILLQGSNKTTVTLNHGRISNCQLAKYYKLYNVDQAGYSVIDLKDVKEFPTVLLKQ